MASLHGIVSNCSTALANNLQTFIQTHRIPQHSSACLLESSISIWCVNRFSMRVYQSNLAIMISTAFKNLLQQYIKEVPLSLCISAQEFEKIKNFRSDKEFLLLFTHGRISAIKNISQQLLGQMMTCAMCMCVRVLSCECMQTKSCAGCWLFSWIIKFDLCLCVCGEPCLIILWSYLAVILLTQ